MEHKIYTIKGLKKPGFIQRILGKQIKENAILEINNLLAEKELREITLEDIHGIATQYNVNFNTDYDHEITDFYKVYLKSCLEDKFISDSEVDDLKHLKFILNINDKKIDEIHQELAGMIYKSEVQKIIKDGELDEAERNFIEKLQNDLKLPVEVATKIYQKSGQELIQSFMNSALEDNKLTPDEEKELYAIAKNLNAEVLDQATQADLEKYKLFFQIENDNMPELSVNISIPRNEKCYFQTNALWLENEKIQISSTSSSLSLKIAKGQYWRNPNNETRDLIKESWQKIDEGTLYLTNKRVFFQVSGKSDKVVLLNRIIDFVVYTNGIAIQKEDNKCIFLEFEKSSDIFAMLLGKAIAILNV